MQPQPIPSTHQPSQPKITFPQDLGLEKEFAAIKDDDKISLSPYNNDMHIVTMLELCFILS